MIMLLINNEEPCCMTDPVKEQRLHQQINFLVAIDGLKNVMRRSLLADGSRRENTAEHSWHVAMAASLLIEHANEPVDAARTIQMMLVHDLVELYAGDTYIYDQTGGVGQLEREQEAADRLFGLLPADQSMLLRELWDEFESLATPESRYCKAIDRFMPLLLNWHSFGQSWRENNVNDVMVEGIIERIKPGSEAIWSYAGELKDLAVELGYLYKKNA